MNKIKEGIFTEKYRPQELNEIVGDFSEIEKFIKDPKTLPHFLFLGKKGTGKTSLAFIIIKKIGADYIKLNASDESSIDVMRGRVKKFAQTLSSKPGIPKIIFLDEADYLGGGTSKTAQAALRGMMEDYVSNCRFILTANYQRKIIEEIQSRCHIIKFGNINKQELLEHTKKICDNEKKKYDIEGLKKNIDINYPDVRKMVVNLQVLDEITIDKIKSKEEKALSIFNLIKEQKVTEARKIWVNEGLDCRELLKNIFEIIMKSDLKNKRELVNLCGLYDYRFCISGDPDIQMTDFSVKLLSVLK